MKIKNSIKKICEKCFIKKRYKKIFVLCLNKKHKQKQK